MTSEPPQKKEGKCKKNSKNVKIEKDTARDDTSSSSAAALRCGEPLTPIRNYGGYGKTSASWGMSQWLQHYQCWTHHNPLQTVTALPGREKRSKTLQQLTKLTTSQKRTPDTDYRSLLTKAQRVQRKKRHVKATSQSSSSCKNPCKSGLHA